MKLSKKFIDGMNRYFLKDCDREIVKFLETNDIYHEIRDGMEIFHFCADQNKTRGIKGIEIQFDRITGEIVAIKAIYNKTFKREDVALIAESALEAQYKMIKAGYIE